jgi:capsular exopolysaccharide synthesis family protein
MSKIFEALQKERGEIAEIILPQLDGEPGGCTTAAPDRAPEPPVRPLSDDRGRAAAPDDAAAGIRQLAIQLRGSGPLLPFDGTDSAAAEQYRIVRTRLLQHPKRPRALLITSAGARDGKSVTAINVAGALSLKGQDRILLADTDFRRSTIHTQLGFPASPGLTDVLSGRATLREVLIRTEQFPNLYVATAGSPLPNPSELLDSQRWSALCDEMRAEFRYVIADSPPVASVADYELLQAAFDGVLMVARPDHTKRAELLTALEIVPKEKLIGMVMNCVPEWFLTRSSSYKGYYYSHGEAPGRDLPSRR